MPEPTVTQTDSVPSTPALEIPTDGPAYHEWRMSGKLPSTTEEDSASSGKEEDKQENDAVADPAPQKDDKQDDDAAVADSAQQLDKALTDAAGSEPAKPPQKKFRSKTAADTEKRIRELSDQVRNEREAREKLQRDLEANAKPKEKAADPNAEPGMDDIDPATGKGKYATVADYFKARDTWLENKVLSSIDGRAEQAQKSKAAEAQNKAVMDGFQERTSKARAKYADFDEVVFNDKLPIPHNSTMEATIVLSEYGPNIAYMLGKNPAEAERISKLGPYEQAREMFRLELLAGGWDGLIKDQRFSTKLSTSAKPLKLPPAPPNEVSGRGTIPSDAVEQAVKEGDQAAYAAAANARDMARFRGRKKGR